MSRIVIAGGGAAALCAAERLRERGYAGQIVVIGAEAHRPYNRTPLNKGLLTGQLHPGDLALRAHTDPAATWRTGEPAAALDLSRREVTLRDGWRLEFDGLIIATGAAPRIPPGVPDSPRIHTVRTLEDARALDAALAGARHVAVVGGGFIGCEIACTARERALQVTMIGSAPTLMARPLGVGVGRAAERLHREHGVRLHLGTSVTDWHTGTDGVSLRLTDGAVVQADTVVLATGTAPSSGWLRGSGVQVGDGVLCDATTHVLGPDRRPLDAVTAAGDVAAWPNHRFDPVPRRVEHWINAIEMGQHAADAILAGPSRARPYTPVPRFWSQQHGVRIQAAGMPALGADTVILAGTQASGRFLVGYTRPGPHGEAVLVGAVAFDAPRALARHHPMIGRPLADLGPQRRERRPLDARAVR